MDGAEEQPSTSSAGPAEVAEHAGRQTAGPPHIAPSTRMRCFTEQSHDWTIYGQVCCCLLGMGRSRIDEGQQQLAPCRRGVLHATLHAWASPLHVQCCHMHGTSQPAASPCTIRDCARDDAEPKRGARCIASACAPAAVGTWLHGVAVRMWAHRRCRCRGRGIGWRRRRGVVDSTGRAEQPANPTSQQKTCPCPCSPTPCRLLTLGGSTTFGCPWGARASRTCTSPYSHPR